MRVAVIFYRQQQDPRHAALHSSGERREKTHKDTDSFLVSTKLSVSCAFCRFTWDIMKMEQGLRQSAEYRRLVALQRNTVHADMDLISDRQTIEMVKARYTKINGSPPDEDTLKFLLERYRASKSDDVY
jgi:hypothetical protein